MFFSRNSWPLVQYGSTATVMENVHYFMSHPVPINIKDYKKCQTRIILLLSEVSSSSQSSTVRSFNVMGLNNNRPLFSVITRTDVCCKCLHSIYTRFTLTHSHSGKSMCSDPFSLFNITCLCASHWCLTPTSAAFIWRPIFIYSCLLTKMYLSQYLVKQFFLSLVLVDVNVSSV